MNTIVYRAFADELALIKQAQLEKEALSFGALGKGFSTGFTKLRGLFTGGAATAAPRMAPRAVGGLGGAKTIAATPGAASRISGVAPTMPSIAGGGLGRTQIGAPYLPSYPGGMAARPGGLPVNMRPPREMSPLQAMKANESDLMQRIRARNASMPSGSWTRAQGIGKQQVTMGSLSPLQRTQLRLSQERWRQSLAA